MRVRRLAVSVTVSVKCDGRVTCRLLMLFNWWLLATRSNRHSLIVSGATDHDGQFHAVARSRRGGQVTCSPLARGGGDGGGGGAWRRRRDDQLAGGAPSDVRRAVASRQLSRLTRARRGANLSVHATSRRLPRHRVSDVAYSTPSAPHPLFLCLDKPLVSHIYIIRTTELGVRLRVDRTYEHEPVWYDLTSYDLILNSEWNTFYHHHY